eukprot:653341-Heterocapsa_arctica.AAC.1
MINGQMDINIKVAQENLEETRRTNNLVRYLAEALHQVTVLLQDLTAAPGDIANARVTDRFHKLAEALSITNQWDSEEHKARKGDLEEVTTEKDKQAWEDGIQARENALQRQMEVCIANRESDMKPIAELMETAKRMELEKEALAQAKLEAASRDDDIYKFSETGPWRTDMTIEQ